MTSLSHTSMSWLAWLGLFFILFLTAGVRAAPERDRVLRVAMWIPAFTSFNPTDARTAVRVWVEKWGKKSGLYERAEAEIFVDLSMLERTKALYTPLANHAECGEDLPKGEATP